MLVFSTAPFTLFSPTQLIGVVQFNVNGCFIKVFGTPVRKIIIRVFNHPLVTGIESSRRVFRCRLSVGEHQTPIFDECVLVLLQ